MKRIDKHKILLVTKCKCKRMYPETFDERPILKYRKIVVPITNSKRQGFRLMTEPLPSTMSFFEERVFEYTQKYEDVGGITRVWTYEEN